jgi:hypothetical protein
VRMRAGVVRASDGRKDGPQRSQRILLEILESVKTHLHGVHCTHSRSTAVNLTPNGSFGSAPPRRKKGRSDADTKRINALPRGIAARWVASTPHLQTGELLAVEKGGCFYPLI